jgi:precorrin-6B methylase 1
MPSSNGPGTGSLVVVGTGIRVVGQLTTEAIAWMRRADRLLYSVGDPLAEATILQLNPAGAESLTAMYAPGKPRIVTYHQMVERILECVRSGMLTCVATYGHPGVFAYPTHAAIRQARAEGYPARMLPGISAEDCLFADLGVDPATTGCQSFEATDFLLYGRAIDTSAAVVIWQIGVTGDLLYGADGYDLSLLPLLVDRLCQFYPPDHVCTIYEAAVYPDSDPSIQAVPIRAIGDVPVRWASTLYIPPSRTQAPDPLILSRIGAVMVAGATRSAGPPG